MCARLNHYKFSALMLLRSHNVQAKYTSTCIGIAYNFSTTVLSSSTEEVET